GPFHGAEVSYDEDRHRREGAPGVHPADDERECCAHGKRDVQALAARCRYAERRGSAQVEARRGARADQRAARPHVPRRTTSLYPVRDGILPASPLRSLPRASGSYGTLAGDGTGELDLRGSPRDGRRLCPWVVARPRPQAAPANTV